MEGLSEEWWLLPGLANPQILMRGVRAEKVGKGGAQNRELTYSVGRFI